jgi:hypothetical protein
MPMLQGHLQDIGFSYCALRAQVCAGSHLDEDRDCDVDCAKERCQHFTIKYGQKWYSIEGWYARINLLSETPKAFGSCTSLVNVIGR